MKKTIALVSALAVVFCCSFPAFATTPTGRRREASYDYGDVSLHVSVDAGASVTYNNDVCHYDHRFTVTLTNKTNTFQVADQNILGFKLYTGRKDYFDNTFSGSSGTTQTNASWGAEVTSYSDNMTVPDIKFYTSASSGWEGCVYIKFNDSDLLVLNPNETRTYNFTIDFIASQTVSAMPINGNYVYGYFTYLSNSSISIFNKPNTFTSNSVEDFLNNDSFPNSIIPWLMAAYDQGVVDQQKYDKIISILLDHIDPANPLTSQSTGQLLASRSISHTTGGNNSIPFETIIYAMKPRIVYNYFDPDINGYISNGQVYAVDFYISNRIQNNLNQTFALNTRYLDLNFVPVISTNGKFVGSELSIVNEERIAFRNFGGNYISYQFEDLVDGKFVVANGESFISTIRITYYYANASYDDTYTDLVVNSVNLNNITVNQTFSWSVYNEKWYSNIFKNFADIRDRLQSILDSYQANSNAAEDVTDSAESSSNTIDNQHQTESNYFSDSQSAIQDTGIQNFQFTPQESAGLNGLKDDFTAVWVSCGTLSRVWITSLTIGLALAIIRHRRMFQK